MRIITIILLFLTLAASAFAQEWRLPDPEFEPGQTGTSAAQRKAEEIAASIENEINSPSLNEKPIGSFLSYSQNRIRRLIFDLAGLGVEIADHIYSKSTVSQPQVKSALTISLGLMGDPRVHEEIRNMMANEMDLNMRTLAALALGKYNDTTDVPLLVRALNDITEVIVQLDFPAPNGEYFDRTYPVRGAANNALVDMGYRIYKDSTSGAITVKKVE
jgi:hypothetical protein